MRILIFYLISLGLIYLIELFSKDLLISITIVSVLLGLIVRDYRELLISSQSSFITYYLLWILYYLKQPYGFSTLNILSEIVGFPNLVIVLLPLILLSLVLLTISLGTFMILNFIIKKK